ncbi:MAG: HAMP domain-containing histidine kinase [Lachnospiraceae bacterium]|nr:HAMP domain-containing histidine kinase [Lachnospiraceae bacterium]
MKIRQITAGITICILAFIMITVTQMQKDGEEYIPDMVWYNGEVRAIENELEKGTAREAIEKEHGCSLLFTSAADYQGRLNEYMMDNSMIMDLYVNDNSIGDVPEGVFAGKAVWQTKQERYDMLRDRMQWEVIVFGILLLLLIYAVLLILYLNYIRPFRILREFAAQVAKGNLELALPIRKNNFFGVFTESFDLMRQELKRARESEYQANISKKELIAELSHDIKTPVATIKATCEVMQVTEQKEDTLRKIGVIAGKAEMIDNLVGNMFHATMEELEVLKVEPIEESSLIIPEMFHDFKYYGQITLENDIPECLLYFDKLRLQQVLDNIINNSYKYAGTEVKVRFIENAEGIIIKIRDFGQGTTEEELALIKEKFYRGSNTEGKSGSGLGLYLADNFMKQMGGEIECYNEDGFVVELFLRKG